MFKLVYNSFHSIMFINVTEFLNFVPYLNLVFLTCLLLKVVYSYFLQLMSATIGSFPKSQEFNVVAVLETVTILGYIY